MFSGLIRHTGSIISSANGRLVVKCALPKSKLGDSVSVNGVCLTVVACKRGQLTFDVSPETISKTTIGQWRAGRPVNIEPALMASDSLGGHLVQGHVDGVGWLLE